ncbi:MAG TPA: hypothetical protein VF174_01145 [Micromonosporaceae bacterium]
MRRTTTLTAIGLLLLTAACGQPGQAGSTPNDQHEDAFQQRADAVAEAWRSAPAREAWHKGFIPLQATTVLPADPGFDDETKQAFLAGWYRTQVSLPAAEPADGTVEFPDGTLTVPLISAREAYQQLDQGDPPPCPRERPAPAPTSGAPDTPVDSGITGCTVLTVTGATLGTTQVVTSRGMAEVPAWLFTVEELNGPVAQLAVAASAVTEPPTFTAPDTAVEGVVSAQSLASVEGNKLTYRLGVGACDTDIRPLVVEYDDVVVVAGFAKTPDTICTTQLVEAPVTVTLEIPLGARPVLDAVTGQPLRLRTVIG